MVGGKHDPLRIDRRTALKLAAGAGLAATSALQMPRAARADNTTLSIWTGYPELVPYYQAVAEAYAKTKPGVTCTILSTSLREHEQKLSAAVPTGTGPDIFDIGINISDQLHRGRPDRAERGRRSTSTCRAAPGARSSSTISSRDGKILRPAAAAEHGGALLQQDDVQGGRDRRPAGRPSAR